MKYRYIALLLVAVTVITCLSACKSKGGDDEIITTSVKATTAKVTDNTSFKISYTQSDSLNPFKAKTQNNQVLATLVFESLFDLDESYEPVANIATGYEYTDKTVLRVDINPQLSFSNGSKITAEDVAYSFEQAKDSPAYGGNLTSIKSAQASGTSVYFYLKYPNPYAVNVLTFPISAQNTDKNGYPIGSGRYSYKEIDSKTVLKANKIDNFDPYITTINLVNIAAADSIDNAINIGNISYAFRDLSTDTSKRLSCAKKAVNINNLVFIGVNSKYGITSNAHIRQAISLAVDRTMLVESAYSAYASAAISPFNPSFAETKDISIFSKEADPAPAKQAIVQSGYSSDKLTLTLLVNNNEARLACATLLKSQLEAVGFKVIIYKESDKNYQYKIKHLDFDIYIGEVKLSDDMSLYPFFKGNAKYGIDLKNMSCDNLYAKYLAGEEELGKFILAFNEEMPFIPILYKKGMICYTKAMNGDMQGYYNNFFSNIESWNFNP